MPGRGAGGGGGGGGGQGLGKASRLVAAVPGSGQPVGSLR